jgi:hypothetical protein
MNRTPLLSVGLLGLTLLSAQAQHPSANQILREMSDTLAAAQTFSFSATREIDAELLGDVEVPVKSAKVCVLVQRPDKLAIRSKSNAGTRQFLVDGRTLTSYESRTNFYSVSPVPGTIDALVDELDVKYGFTPPLADYAVSNPYNELRRSAHTVKYLGRERVTTCFLGLGGVVCDRIALIGDEAEAELWIGVADHLPRRLVATFKSTTKPQLRIEFHKWNLAAEATDADFTFTRPKGATQIEMWTVSKMQKPSRR